MEDKIKKAEPLSNTASNKVPLSDPKETKEINGRNGLEPTRYGDWEKNGRCIDF
jgi:hypothetical protein